MHPNSFGSRAEMSAGGRNYDYFRLAALRTAGLDTVDRLPFSLKILL